MWPNWSRVGNFLIRCLGWRRLDSHALLRYYRNASLFVTSVFYLVGPPAGPFCLKAGAVLFLILEAHAFNRVYGAKGNGGQKKLLIFVETVGLAALLIITGGLDSPFTWYAINPILLAATLEPAYYCWLMTATFLLLAAFLQQFNLFVPQKAYPFWPDRSFFFIVFFLITFAAQIFTHLVVRLTRQTEAGEKQLQHIKALYEAIGVFSGSDDLAEVVNLFAECCWKLTEAEQVIVWVEAPAGSPGQDCYTVKGSEVLPDAWYGRARDVLSGGKDWAEFSTQGSSGESVCFIAKIRSVAKVYGVLSAYCRDENRLQIKNTLKFMAELCAATLEKRTLEALAEQYLLREEKDRIAAEIHDSVSQNIFGLIYGLETLLKEQALPQDIRERVRLMQMTARDSLKDLRASIYTLSSKEEEGPCFIDEVGAYLADLGRLNGINVDFDPGQSLDFNSLARKSLYRIVREATGNAIRHGRCTAVSVSLAVKDGVLALAIADDGRGFIPCQEDKSRHSGMGLANMRELTTVLGGKFAIRSAPGQGTEVCCLLPLPNTIRRG